jgi:hypothetical protein
VKARGASAAAAAASCSSGEPGGEASDDGRARAAAVRNASGAVEHTRHRRRCRARSVGVGGGFMVQFWGDSAGRVHGSMHREYPADDSGAALALGHHVPRAAGHAPAGELARRVQAGRARRGAMGGVDVDVDVQAAVQRVADELVAVLEQVGAELAAGARQAVQRVEVELARELADDAVSGARSATSARADRAAGSRITAQRS